MISGPPTDEQYADVLRAVNEGRAVVERRRITPDTVAETFWFQLPGMPPEEITTTVRLNHAGRLLHASGALYLGIDIPAMGEYGTTVHQLGLTKSGEARARELGVAL